jgi:hypothetical protein
MAIAEVSYDTVLRYAKQLTAEEQAQLIGQLAQGLVADSPVPPPTDKMELLEGIRAQLRESGHVPPTPEEVIAYIEAERNSWSD